MKDARRLRQFLATKLLLDHQNIGGENEAREKFLRDLEDAINDVDTLRSMLLPVVKEVCCREL